MNAQNPGDRSLKIACALLAAATLAAAWPLTGYEFTTHDDPQEVYSNPDLFPVTGDSLRRIWGGPDYGHVYIPVHYTFLAGLAQAARWADRLGPTDVPRPWLFHSVQVCLHAASALLLLFLLLRSGVRVWPAFFGAAIFALHPLQVEGYARASGTTMTLGALFALLSLHFYLSSCRPGAGRGRWALAYGAATAAFVLALLTRSGFVVLPLVAAALDLFAGRRIGRQQVLRLVPWVAVAAAYGLLSLRLQPEAAAYLPYEVSLWQRPLIAADALSFYATRTLLPFGLTIDHGRTPADALSSGGAFLSWLVPAGLLALTLAVPRGSRLRLASGLAVWALALLPMSGLLPAPSREHFSIVADRYAYFAFCGVALVAAELAGLARREHALVAGSALLLFFGWRTWAQVPVWQDSVTLFSHCVERNPRSWYCTSRLGSALLERGHTEAAEALLHRALELRPSHTEALVNLGRIELARGELDAAAPRFEKALSINPHLSSALNNLGIVATRRGRPGDAVGLFRRAASLAPGIAELHNNLGRALLDSGKPAEAVAPFEKAIALGRSYAEPHKGLALALLEEGRTDEARGRIGQALAVAPADLSALLTLVRIEQAAGNADRALQLLEQAAATDQARGSPEEELSLFRALGRAHAGRGDPAKAVPALRRAAVLARRLGDEKALAETTSLLESLGAPPGAAGAGGGPR